MRLERSSDNLSAGVRIDTFVFDLYFDGIKSVQCNLSQTSCHNYLTRHYGFQPWAYYENDEDGVT